MSDVIARTKIMPPRRRGDLLSRPRLLSLLNDLLGHRLILLVAPAGYGKTSLLIDYAQHIPMPVCWLGLEALDRETYRFFAHLIASLAQRFPGIEPATQAALQTYVAGQSRLEQLVTVLVNELYEQANDEYFIIVDDYHLVAENEEVNAFFSQFVQQVDENCHVILAARQLLGLPDMPLLVARGYVSGLDFEDLAFSDGEVQQLILQNYGQSLTAGEATDLVKATEGWITGLLLSAQSRLRNVPERVRRLRAAGVDLYDYLAQQVLDQQPELLRRFLLHSALFDEFDKNLCERIFDPEWLPPGYTWQRMIDLVLERNLFATAVGEQGAWVRYHHLFQEFLERQLARERPDEEGKILHRLANYHVEQRAWERAYGVYQKLGDLQAVAGLLETAGGELFQQDRILLVDGWLAALPQALLQERPPLLSLWGAILARRGQMNEGLALLNQAIARLQGGISLDLGYALVRRATVYRMLGDENRALADGEGALALIAQLPGQLSAQPLQALALKTVGIILDELGRAREGSAYLQQALAIYQARADRQNEATVLQELARIQMAAGAYTQASALFQRALTTLRSLANFSSQAITLNNLGVLYHLQGDYLAAIDALEEAHVCAERSGYTRFMVYSLASLGDLLVDIELWEPARNVYRQALVGANGLSERFLTLYLELALAGVATALGNWEQAFARLDTAAALLGSRKSGEGWARYQLAMGRYYLACGRPADAIPPLADARARFAAAELLIEQTTAFFYLAAAYDAAGNAIAAQTALEEGLAVTFKLEVRRPLIMALRTVKTALQALTARQENRRELEQLLAEVQRFEAEIPMISRRIRHHQSPLLQSWLAETTPKLLIRALGRAEVINDGRTIANRDWQTQSARDLFFCLLAHPEGLTREQVGALFWPDASPNDLRTRFKNSIYRLRTALSEEVVRFDDEIYFFNRAFDYEYDVENFKSKVTQGAAASDPAVKLAAYTAALESYRGEYLPDVEAGWAAFERAHLSRLFFETALALGELHLNAGDYRAALETAHRALEHDSCSEDAHRVAMRAYAGLGNRAGVVRQYRLCQQALLEELEVPPSPQTVELYELLTH
jgi:LuxR family transcriptional regulator, maltose regulon positive regulatory protein